MFDLDLLFKVTGCHFVVHTYSFIYFPGMRPSAPILCLSVYIETLYHIYSGFWSKTILTFLTNVFNYTPTQFNCPAFIGIAIFNCGPWLIFMYTFGTKHKLDYAIAGVFITFSDSSSFFYRPGVSATDDFNYFYPAFFYLLPFLCNTFGLDFVYFLTSVIGILLDAFVV